MQCSTTCLTTFLKFKDWSITSCQTFVNNHHTMCVHHLLYVQNLEMFEQEVAREPCTALQHGSTTMSVPVLLLWKQQASLAVISSRLQVRSSCITAERWARNWPENPSPLITNSTCGVQVQLSVVLCQARLYDHHVQWWQDMAKHHQVSRGNDDHVPALHAVQRAAIVDVQWEVSCVC